MKKAIFTIGLMFTITIVLTGCNEQNSQNTQNIQSNQIDLSDLDDSKLQISNFENQIKGLSSKYSEYFEPISGDPTDYRRFRDSLTSTQKEEVENNIEYDRGNLKNELSGVYYAKGKLVDINDNTYNDKTRFKIDNKTFLDPENCIGTQFNPIGCFYLRDSIGFNTKFDNINQINKGDTIDIVYKIDVKNDKEEFILLRTNKGIEYKNSDYNLINIPSL